MTTRIGFKEMLARAEAEIRTITAQEAIAKAQAPDTVFVDLRDIREVTREGRIPGSFHMPRGMLEFWIDPESPYFKPIFSADKEFVFHCNKGWRSALATATAQTMGLRNVCHIGGGFAAWVEAGGPTETVEKK